MSAMILELETLRKTGRENARVLTPGKGINQENAKLPIVLKRPETVLFQKNIRELEIGVQAMYAPKEMRTP